MGMSTGLMGQEKKLDELLAMSLDDLANLQVVSALKGPGTPSTVPATVRVITSKLIRAWGYRTLEDALADLPGFQFRNIQGFNSYVFMRGVPQQNNKILLLVDGIQINELNSGGFYGGGHFNLTNVERIEVVYGPASSLYGTNAVSGIINVITRDPKDASGGKATVMGGSFSTHQADIRYGRFCPDKNAGFTLSAMANRTRKSDLRGDQGDGNWTDEMDNFEENIAVDGQFRVGELRGGFIFQDKNASRATTILSTPGSQPTYLDHGTNWHIGFLNAWIHNTWNFKKVSIRSTAYVRDSTVKDDTIPLIEAQTAASPGRQFRQQRPGRKVGNESQLLWTPLEGWRISAGLVLERERLAQSFVITESESQNELPGEPGPAPMLTHRVTSLYLNAQIPLWSDLDAFLGLRHEDSSIYGRVDTPRMGLVFNRGRLNAKCLYGQAFRAPKPWDYTDGKGNPDLKPETAHSWEFSGGWKFNDTLHMDVSIFHNQLDNLLARASQGEKGWWANAESLTANGCEASLEYRTALLRIYGNYTYTDSRSKGLPVDEIAKHTGNAGFQWTFKPGFHGGLRGQYRGERTNPKLIPNTQDRRIHPSLVLNASLLWEPSPTWNLQLFADNLLDATYYDPSNLPPSRYRQPQRSFRLQLGWNF